MNRTTVLEWLRQHPDLVHGDADVIVDRCGRAVRRHAREDAWGLAMRYVAERQHLWEESRGAHASEEYVAHEVCGQLAQELRNHEPTPHRGDEDHLAGGPVKAALEQQAWEYLVTARRVRHVLVIGPLGPCGIVSIGDVVKQRLQETELEVSVLRDYARAR